MAKDPAFLFYPGDWIGGTLGMTFEEKGAYMELLVLQFNTGKFTKEQAKHTLNVRFDAVWSTIERKFKCDGRYYHNARLAEEKEKREKYTESRRNSRLKTDEDSVRVYLILDLDTGYYKIGSSVNPLRRFSEMKNQKNPAITFDTRNYELFFVSKIVERSVEKSLHKLYKKNRIIGEWFDLSETDLNNIKTTYGEETYVQRTEDENEDEDEDINAVEKNAKSKKNKTSKDMSTAKDTVDIPLPFKGPAFASIWAEWLRNRKEARIKNYTPTGLKRLFKWLVTASGDNEAVAIQIIDQSLVKGWQGLFELKPQFNGNTTRRITEKPQPTGNVAPGGFGQL